MSVHAFQLQLKNKNLFKSSAEKRKRARAFELCLFDQGAMQVLPIGDMEKNWKFKKSWTNHVGDPDCCVARWGQNNV